MEMRLKFDEAIYGVDKKINIDVTEECDECNGAGGHNPKTCSTCHGSGQVRTTSNTILGQIVTNQTCPDCHGKGKTFEIWNPTEYEQYSIKCREFAVQNAKLIKW